MNPEVGKIVQQLADKLGVTVQYLWAVLVRGNRVEGVIQAVFAVLAVGIAYVGYRLLKHAKSEEGDYHEDFGYGFGGLAAILAGLVVFCVCLYGAIMGIFCPEYGALSDILSYLK